MAVLQFPPVETARGDGLLAAGGDLEVESLLLAYRSGIFPWPVYEDVLTWFAPAKRAVFFVDKLHISRSLQRELRREKWRTQIDTAFADVIAGCQAARNRAGDAGTWITDEMRSAYIALHRAGYAHSIECFENGELAGGLYGVAIGGFFSAESMFYHTPNASKICLCRLAEHLATRGVEWFDSQVINPFTRKMGAIEITRKKYMNLLQAVIAREVTLFP
jgi:leucyl/phenylalanyl-tRNA--protein transferase